MSTSNSRLELFLRETLLRLSQAPLDPDSDAANQIGHIFRVGQRGVSTLNALLLAHRNHPNDSTCVRTNSNAVKKYFHHLLATRVRSAVNGPIYSDEILAFIWILCSLAPFANHQHMCRGESCRKTERTQIFVSAPTHCEGAQAILADQPRCHSAS